MKNQITELISFSSLLIVNNDIRFAFRLIIQTKRGKSWENYVYFIFYQINFFASIFDNIL